MSTPGKKPLSDSTDTDELSLRETIAAIGDVVSYRPGLSVAILGLSLLVGVLEGIGVGFILPIVTVVQQGGGSELSGPVRVFVDVYTTLGLPFTLEYIIVGVGCILALRYMLGVGIAWLTAILGTGYRRHLRLISYDRVLSAQTTYFDAHGSEELLNAILTQTSYASAIITKIVRGLKTALVSTAYGLIALYLAPKLMALTSLVLLLAMAGSKYVFESGYGVGDRLAQANERVQSSLQAGIQGIREVKLFSLEDELQSDFRTAINQQTDASIKKQRDQTALANLNNFFATATVFALVYFAVTSATLSLPGLGVFLFAMFRLAPRVSSLNGLAYDINNDLPHFIRTQKFIERLDRQEEQWGDKAVQDPIERIEFQDVCFAYPTGDGTILDDVSFSVNQGEFIALVGPSGAGKSTLTSLLAGLYQPDSGQILADSTPIVQFTAAEWRSRIAVVKQNPHIFNETLRYNLTVGNREASEAAIAAACSTAQVTEFLDELPAGYDTVLGDDGVRLSGGQRQRVAIARALLKDADVLVLDEATSELDSTLEARVHGGIERLDRDYAVVAIAHRLSTVTGADTIHVIEAGEIVESGTHDTLLDRGTAYSELYRSQVDETGEPQSPVSD
ncbi:ABC transporter ATP-binding protein [Haloarcula sp. 1CSR25-25]|uniref:ABC transporter ATP-binding protein n=1 Tax=Haloarcula sp. 1CSR25-25 TaxID=2862545 RepID=UPI002896197C|nr:ABC transporter ATP-binding protein [Haloarcula sp. 1CSR25-25]MDT3435585.1 ABC transporter ATP-binding protein/permease [Haloarcula sp. 1CSR25-25]